MKLISEGAEADIYLTRLYGSDVLIKYRQKKRYRIEVLDTKLRKTRTKKEAKIMARASSMGIKVPRLVGVGTTSIYMEMLHGTLLKDMKISSDVAGKSGELLARLHNSGITHGDFTPANLIVNDGEVYAIDFGLSEINESSEERALDVLLMKRQMGKDAYSEFEKHYCKVADSGKEVMSRLEGIEKRGRYQVRTLA